MSDQPAIEPPVEMNKDPPKEVDAKTEQPEEENFAVLWPKLKEQGWSYKNGTGLVAWIYCR